MHLLSPCVLVALQYHLSQTDEALKYNNSTTDLHKSLQCPANCLYYSLVGWVWDREMFEDSFPFPEKSLFYVEKDFNHRVAKSCTITAPVIIVRCALTTDDLVVCRKVVKLF